MIEYAWSRVWSNGTRTTVRKVLGPIAPGYSRRRWCLAWRTPSMPASASWYFHTKRQAVLAARQMAPGGGS